MFGVIAQILNGWWTLTNQDPSLSNQNNAGQDILTRCVNQSSDLSLVIGLETVKGGGIVLRKITTPLVKATASKEAIMGSSGKERLNSL